MTNVAEMTKVCLVCNERKPLNAFSSYREANGQLAFGLICYDCTVPATDASRKQTIQQISSEIQQKKLASFDIEQALVSGHRQFGEVTKPEAPPELPSASADQELFANEGNEFGHGNGGGRAHPILSEAAQFQGELPSQTPNAAESEDYNRLLNDLKLRQELNKRLALTNQAMNRPTGPMR